MHFFKFLIEPVNHCEDSVIFLCKELNINITSSTIKKELLEHPDYPSLLSISDILKQYKVQNMAIRIGIDDFHKIPVPFIASINGRKTRHSIFAVVLEVENNFVELYSPENKKVEKILIEEFAKLYEGVALAVEKEDYSGDKEYYKNKKLERQQGILQNIIIFSLPALTILDCCLAFANDGIGAIGPVLFTILTLAGCGISALLLWHEIDEFNPTVKQICNIGRKVNCSAILNSKAAKIFGISWSILGSTYFMGMFIALLIGGITDKVNLFLLSWINIMALPYIAYSICYQYFVAKQWCTLCLLVQGILLIQFITALIGGFFAFKNFNGVSVQSYLTIIGSFVTVFAVLLLLIPALKKAKDHNSKVLLLQRLKHNTQIFETLLDKQKSIGNSAEGLGIAIGNSNAKYIITKVCNPYCGPCAKAHPLIEELLNDNNQLQLRIIFTASDNKDDIRAKPVRHLLAIAANGNEALTRKALNDWYLADEKNYDVFASKYTQYFPGSEEVENNLKKMNQWCDKTEINFTPTFFINGNQLPEMYNIEDLKYFITSDNILA